ncbi:MAG: replication protein P [Halopseudomonas sp.]
MLFARFMTIYGHKFKSTFEGDDELLVAKREWALSLRGYSEQELVLAVDRCKEQFVWMPTIAEFLALMRKDLQDYGLPSALSAYQEACLHADHPRERDWNHPAVYFAGRATDWFRLRTEDKFDVFADFEFNYRQFCQRVIDGEDLAVPLQQGLPDKSSDTLALFVQQWGEQQGITPQQAATLLYYLEKPKGSPVRAHFKQHSMTKASEWGLTLTLPDEVSSL